MGNCRVEEDTDQDVEHDEQASNAEESLQEVHSPTSSRWILVLSGIRPSLGNSLLTTIVHAYLSAELTLRTTAAGKARPSG
jgi:hypothetical protein